MAGRASEVQCNVNLDISPDDPEVKKVQAFVMGAQHERMATISECLGYFSDWHRAKRAVATYMKFKASFQQNPSKLLHAAMKTTKEKDTSTYRSPSMDEVRKAEQAIITPGRSLFQRNQDSQILRGAKRRCKQRICQET